MIRLHHRSRWWLPTAGALVALLLLVGARPATAQSGNDAAAAEQLFNDARELMDSGKYAEACDKLQASLALDPAAGTAVNLAVCLEKIGKLASAWTRFREAEDLDNVSGNRGRQKFARERAKALEPRLPKLVIRVPVADTIPGVKVVRNNSVVPSQLYGTAVYVDPGVYVILAVAPGHQKFSRTVEAKEGEVSEVVISALALEGQESDEESAGDIEPRARGAESRDGGRRVSSSARRTLGVTAMAVGAVSTAVGVGTGLLAASNVRRVSDEGLCDTETWVCTQEGDEIVARARAQANATNFLVIGGVVLAGVGAIVYVTAPKRRKAHAIRVTPVTSREQVGLALSGRF